MIARIVAAAAAAVLLAASGTASAASAPPPQSAEVQIEAMESWLAEFSAWSSGLNVLVANNLNTLNFMIDGADALTTKLTGPDARSATIWSREWAVRARARLAQDREAYSASSGRMPPFPSSVPMSSGYRTRIAAMSHTADRTGAMLLSSWQASERFIVELEGVNSGSDEDLVKIDRARMGLLIAQLQAENTMMEAQSAAVSGPGVQLLRLTMVGNESMIAWIENNRRVIIGDDSGAAATQTTMRTHSATARRLVNELNANIATGQQSITAEPELAGSALGAALVRILDSARQTAAVELQMATALDELAAAIGTADPEDDVVAAEAVGSLADRRSALDAERRQILAGIG